MILVPRRFGYFVEAAELSLYCQHILLTDLHRRWVEEHFETKLISPLLTKQVRTIMVITVDMRYG